jgi:4,5-dihydroxyphthalate decarboxylase
VKYITLACGDYDRTRPLADGTVRAAGLELTVLPMMIEEIFFRMARFREFDAAELSLSTYLISVASAGSEDRPFVAIPAFPSRSFRHSGIYVNTASGIEVPRDLVGRIVGVAEYQLTANVWIRGILQDRCGVPVNSVRYRTGGLHEPGRREKVGIELPAGIDIAPVPPGDNLSDMLAEGRIDALYTPRTPRCYTERHPGVRRLFPDFKAAEADYWHATGIFPIMHTVVIRADVYQRDRWIARSLFDAFERARSSAATGMDETAALRYMLPWLAADLEETRKILGTDYWTYGVKGNEAALETMVRYEYEQGLIGRRLDLAELFAAETLEEVLI